METDEASVLERIVQEVRSYRGLKRKAQIGEISSFFSSLPNDIIAARGEDGAVIQIGDRMIVIAADGIMQELINQDPRWAGYCSILVNVHDMLAMRAKPKVAVNVLSSTDEKTLTEIVAGMKEACEKFEVKIVGGHLHPDSEFSSISVAMIGEIPDSKPLMSSTARPGDTVLVICDCRGSFTAGIPFSWDCTSQKSKSEISLMTDRLLMALGHFTSGKDISNPGLLGTLAMLLEASHIGADIDIGEIPQPSGIDLLQWLTTYHGFGFIGTAPKKEIGRISSELSDVGLSVAVIGETIVDRKLRIRLGKCQKTLFDFTKDKITGLF